MLLSLGMWASGLMALLVRERALPPTGPALKGVGIGCLIGVATICYFLGLVHLPVSVGATLANAYVLVTVALTIVVWHRAVTALMNDVLVEVPRSILDRLDAIEERLGMRSD
jgi:drug/metabolite transporter (DMT)-like permease